MKKRILSLTIVIALIGSALIVPMTVSAATTTLLDEKFETTPINSGVTYTATNDITFKNQQITMENSWTIENGKLKLRLKGSDSYDEGHAFRNASDDDRPQIAQLSPVQLKIPFAAVAPGAIIGISLDFGQLQDKGDALEAGLFWSDFASIYDADGNAVIVCKRDRTKDGNYISGKAVGRIDTLNWIGKTEAAKGMSIDLDPSTDNELAAGAGTWNLGTDNTMTFNINTATKKVDITYNGGDRNFSGSTWVGDGDLTKGGYILFEGYLNTWHANGSNFGCNKDTEISFDNISVTAEQDLVPKTLPIHNEMNMADTYGTKIESKADSGRFTIIDEPGVSGNKVLAVNTEAYSGKAASNGTNKLGAVWFPYEGLESDENLKISYRFKDPGKKHNLYWQHFGSVVNDLDDAWNASAGVVKESLRCARYDFDAGFLQGSSGQSATLTYFGMDEANKLGGNLSANGPKQAVVDKYVQNIDAWIRVDIDIERESKKATIKYTNEDTNQVLATGSVYLINDLSSNGALYFKGGPSDRSKNGAETIYLDDVKISTWKALSVAETNLNDSYDAGTPITLTFSDTIADAAKIKEAISIKETVSGAEVAPARISVQLDTTKKVAEITVEDGLKYGKTGYTLKLAGGIIRSEADIALVADYIKTFTTKMGPSVFVASATELSSNSSTITITNPTSDTKSVWALLALYSNNNELIGIDEYKNINLGANTTTEPLTLTAAVDADKTVSTAQILLWDSSTSLIPYHIPVTVK